MLALLSLRKCHWRLDPGAEFKGKVPLGQDKSRRQDPLEPLRAGFAN